MKQEDKELLLKDLCARLPYRVKALAQTHKGNKIGKVITITTKFIDYSNGNATLGELYTEDECFWLDYKLFKPYLRPMSSMTEEESNQLEDITNGWLFHNTYHDCETIYPIGQFTDADQFDNILKGISYLNERHFDYRGLIPLGLALEAPDDMYK